jgi:hypothetical protein
MEAFPTGVSPVPYSALYNKGTDGDDSRPSYWLGSSITVGEPHALARYKRAMYAAAVGHSSAEDADQTVERNMS